MLRHMELVNALAADGHETFGFDDAREILGVSGSATANTLRRLRENGLVERLAKGRYAIRPLGSLGTSTASDDLKLAVGGAFPDVDHRIGYLSALGELGLLTHPVRTVFVACTRQVRARSVSKRRLHVVIERPETIHLGADEVGPSWRSGVERALLDCALRVDLAGGSERLAEAVTAAAAEADPGKITEMASVFGDRGLAGIRRLASLSRVLELPLHLEPDAVSRKPTVRLDPGDAHVDWIDPVFRVAWNTGPDELRSVVGQ